MIFTIKRMYLLGLGMWLNGLTLNGPQSRARTKVVNLIQEALTRIEKDRHAVLDDFAEKDKDGEFKMVESEQNGETQKNYVIPDEKKAEFDKAIADLYDENAELSAPEIGPSLLVVKNIVLNYEKDIDPGLAVAYEKWCEAFENWPKTADTAE